MTKKKMNNVNLKQQHLTSEIFSYLYTDTVRCHLVASSTQSNLSVVKASTNLFFFCVHSVLVATGSSS